MINPVSNVAPSQPVTQPAAVTQASPQAKAQPSGSDTVQISNAAKALLQESLETPAQTAREASAGDRQAIRLQARHAAANLSRK